MAIKVIDVSRYQGEIDWAKVKAAGVRGAMLKTVSTNKSFGGIYIDPYFEKNYAACKRLGIPVGVYYYTYAQDKATADAELAKFKEAIAGKVFEYPAVVDVEDNLLKPLSADALTDLVEYAIKTIEGWGMYAMVYTYLNYSNTELNMKRLEKYDLWLAAYRENRPTAWPHGMWQYSSTGSVDGINGNCDMNWAYKDYPAIIKNAGLNGYEKPAGSEPETVPLSNEPCKMKIGPASSGDSYTIEKYINGLGIATTVLNGYIYTNVAVSAGDQKAIIKECNALGVPYEIYTEPDTPAAAPDVEQVQPKPEPTPEPETPAADKGNSSGGNINTLFKKLSSRKLWAMLLGVAIGAAVAFGIDAETLETIAGAITALISVITYMYTEGKVDAAAAAAAVKQTQRAIEAVKGSE